MITAKCQCGAEFVVGEDAANTVYQCPTCAKLVRLVSAEQLAEGAGVGDFDARVTIVAGPSRVGERVLLGGVLDIELGKLAGKHLQLEGGLVSRAHCKLVRVDFAPGRWKVVDNNSRNGLFVNRQKVSEHELQDGDLVRVGDFTLKFENSPEGADIPAIPEIPPIPGEEAPLVAVATKPKKKKKSSVPNDGPPCPSCNEPVPRGGQFCIPCGINIETGRPLLTAHGVDEDMLHANAATLIKLISYFIPLSIMPIPIASEAYGSQRPWAIWGIAALTIIASISFLVYSWNDQNKGRELMLWAPHSNYVKGDPLSQVPPRVRRKFEKIIRSDPDASVAVAKKAEELKGKVPDEKLEKAAMDAVVLETLKEWGWEESTPGEFHWWQLFTHALLHDTGSVWGFIMHLAGNLLFLIVFGGRVNALIGHVATIVIYPILAAGAAFIHLWAMNFTGSTPMLGASGAIMGLAGMYLILFPVHRVFCAIWIHIWWRFLRTLLFGVKIFALRGFWVLLIYFGYDILMQVLETQVFNKDGGGGGVAHWAHIGGFLLGMIIALGVLFTRLFNCRGGDLLSVMLGKGAWPLIGKPSRWRTDLQPAPAAEAQVA